MKGFYRVSNGGEYRDFDAEIYHYRVYDAPGFGQILVVNEMPDSEERPGQTVGHRVEFSAPFSVEFIPEVE